MSSGNVVMGSGNDFSMKCMVSGNIDSAVIPDETIIHFHASIMVEGTGDGIVPKVNISGGSLHTLMGFPDGWHDHGSEMLRG